MAEPETPEAKTPTPEALALQKEQEGQLSADLESLNSEIRKELEDLKALMDENKDNDPTKDTEASFTSFKKASETLKALESSAQANREDPENYVRSVLEASDMFDDNADEWLDVLGYQEKNPDIAAFKKLVARELVDQLGNDKGLEGLREQYGLPEGATPEAILTKYMQEGAGEISKRAMDGEAAREKAEVAAKKNNVTSTLEEYPELTAKLQEAPEGQTGQVVKAFLQQQYEGIKPRLEDKDLLAQKTKADGISLQSNQVQQFINALGIPNLEVLKDNEAVQGTIDVLSEQFDEHGAEAIAERAKYADLAKIEVGKGTKGEAVITNMDKLSPQAQVKLGEMMNSIPEMYWGSNFANAYVNAIKDGKGGMLKDFDAWKVENARDEGAFERIGLAIQFLLKKFGSLTDAFSLDGKTKPKETNPHMPPELQTFLDRPESEQKRVTELFEKTQALNGEGKTKEATPETADTEAETPQGESSEPAAEVAPGAKRIKVTETQQILTMSMDDLNAWEQVIDVTAKPEGAAGEQRDRMNTYLQQGWTPENLLEIKGMEDTEGADVQPIGDPAKGYTYAIPGKETVSIELGKPYREEEAYEEAGEEPEAPDETPEEAPESEGETPETQSEVPAEESPPPAQKLEKASGIDQMQQEKLLNQIISNTQRKPDGSPDYTKKNEHASYLKGLSREGSLSTFITEGEGDTEQLKAVDYNYTINRDGKSEAKKITLLASEMKAAPNLEAFVEKKKDEQLSSSTS